MRVAAKQLCARFESKAVNQQVAGLAALAYIRKLYPEFVTEEQFLSVSNKTLEHQTEEGWFWEYDGPDVGYLSVTLDCLWDLFDATDDKRFLDSADKAFEFI